MRRMSTAEDQGEHRVRQRPDLPMIQKQIHFFLLAALADLTAFSVCCSLFWISPRLHTNKKALTLP